MSTTTQATTPRHDKKRFKSVFVGDGAVGKTCLIISFIDHEFDEDHVPTVVDNRIHTVQYKDEEVQLNLWDTAGQEEFDNLRLLAYPESDLFVVCFSVVNPESLQNVKRLWLHEIQEKGQAFTRAACLLVGTKNDLRQDERTLNDLQSINQQPVSFEEAEQFAKENGFYAYRECSALTRDGIEEVIMTGIEACLAQKREQKDTAVKTTTETTTTTAAVEKVVEEKGEEKKEQQEPQPPLFMIPFMFVMSVLGKCEIL